MKIAVCQLNPIIGDLKYNKRRILDYYDKGVQDKVDIVVLPELALPGYPPLDLIEKKEFRNKTHKIAQEIASHTKETLLIFGSITEDFEDNIGTGVYNSAVLCYKGKVQFVQNKTLLPNYDVFDEVRYFESAREVFLHEYKGEKLAVSICEDIWNDDDYWKHRRYHIDPVEELVKEGATILINISASPYAYGRRKERYRMLSALTQKNNLPLAYVCTAGAQTDLIFDGGSMCFNNKGELCLLGKTYQEDYFIFDTKQNYSPVKSIEKSFEEEVLSALIFGLKEYAAKTGFKKALIGLSGGIDSALVAYIAVQALGKENVFVVLMPSKYSSKGSVADSEHLIKNLGIKQSNISIQPVFEKTLEQLNPLFKDTPENITEENLQSRIRGLYLMAISNKFGYLLCTTGNKSEIAVGYATLYGDMCGAVAVIGDVYKTDVYKLSNYINKDKEIIPSAIINKAPSAELKFDQTDQDSLPPYDFLDKILRYYLEEYKEIDEISELMKDAETVERVLKMVDKNEFKRKQAAPVLRVSNKAFGCGRRYPIVQGWRK